MSKNLRDHIWIVIPAFNEEKYIRQVLTKVSEFTSQIVVIDDGSQDQTFERAQAMAPHTVRHPINLGKGAALKTGCELVFNQLHGEAVIFLDGDDQHDPHELVTFFQKLEAGEQMVFGERSMSHEMPLLKIMGNRVASFMLLVLFGIYIPDIPSGFKALTKDTYQLIKWDATDYSVELEIAARIAKTRIPFSVIPIATIYHDLERGMTIIDVIKMSMHIFMWKLLL